MTVASSRAPEAGREARPATPEAGVLPTSEISFVAANPEIPFAALPSSP